MAVIVYNKKYTETLKVMLERFRIEYPEYINSKVTYAGRLDPLAEGVVIILTDADVHRKDEFLNLPKIYETKVVFGVSTDSYDLLGIPTLSNNTIVDTERLNWELRKTIGNYMQAYPPYSSKTVHGIPLYQWARQGSLQEISIPKHAIDVYEARAGEISTLTPSELYDIVKLVSLKVEGDFRQDEIVSKWKEQLTRLSQKKFTTATLSFSVSSGTYVRELVSSLGNRLGTGACCVLIRRISIGQYSLDVDKRI